VQKSLTDRIAAMVAVHEQIYRHDEFSRLCARDLLVSIGRKLVSAYGSSVELAYDIDDIVVSADNATPLALLTNEVVTNSLKYAFPGERSGRISIALKHLVEQRVCLTIRDDGVGFDPESVRPGMGSRLIRGVVNQLNGTFTFHGHDGSTFTAELEIAEA
jgi:two-component sensor histidine kinase